MPSLDDLRQLIGTEHGLAVISTSRGDGSIQSSVVNAGVLPHPAGEQDVVGLVARGDSTKLRLLRHRPQATVVVRAGWQWMATEGSVDLIGPDDPYEGLDADRVRVLLRDVFSAATGTHDDWDTYDRVMAEERRCAVLLHPNRVYGVVQDAEG